MRLLITRPQPQADELAAKLQRHGHDVLLAPLTCIVERGSGPLNPRAAQAIALTSRHAAQAAGARLSEGARALPVFAVGGATAGAAIAAGFTDIRVGRADAMDLVLLICDTLTPQDGPLFYPCAVHRNARFEKCLAGRGFTISAEPVYEAREIETLPRRVVDDLRAGRCDAVLLFSPRSAALFRRRLAAADLWPPGAQLRIFCLSEAVAKELQDWPSDQVHVAPRPNEAALISCLEALR
jgi:uroporphyrinogen-III synthase